MSTLTPQIAYETAVRGLARQQWKRSAFDDTDERYCQYRLGDLRCAAGHLIPDERYSPDLERLGALSEKVGEAIFGKANHLISDEERHTLHFIRDMQLCHDRARAGGYPMALTMLKLGRSHDLTWPADVPRPEGLE